MRPIDDCKSTYLIILQIIQARSIIIENTWKRIPHLMQLHGTPRKRHSTINLHKLIKTKHYPKKL